MSITSLMNEKRALVLMHAAIMTERERVREAQDIDPESARAILPMIAQCESWEKRIESLDADIASDMRAAYVGMLTRDLIRTDDPYAIYGVWLAPGVAYCVDCQSAKRLPHSDLFVYRDEIDQSHTDHLVCHRCKRAINLDRSFVSDGEGSLLSPVTPDL